MLDNMKNMSAHNSTAGEEREAVSPDQATVQLVTGGIWLGAFCAT